MNFSKKVSKITDKHLKNLLDSKAIEIVLRPNILHDVMFGAKYAARFQVKPMSETWGKGKKPKSYVQIGI